MPPAPMRSASDDGMPALGVSPPRSARHSCGRGFDVETSDVGAADDGRDARTRSAGRDAVSGGDAIVVPRQRSAMTACE